MPATVYALLDPPEIAPPVGRIRYVGVTGKTLSVRLSCHISEAITTRHRARRLKWIRSVLAKGVCPLIVPLEECDGDGFMEETCHIALAYADGLQLVNSTIGGEGSPGCKRTAAWKAKMAGKFTGRFVSEATKKRMSDSKRLFHARTRVERGRVPSAKFTLAEEDAICAEYRAGGRTKVMADRLGVHRDVISDIFRRHDVMMHPHSLTPEQVEKMRRSKTGKRQPPDVVALRIEKSKAGWAAKRGALWYAVADEYRSGDSAKAIAVRHGIHVASVFNIIKKLGVPARAAASSP